MKTAGCILLPLLLFSAATAEARDIYCNSQPGRFPAGTDFTREWYVVNSTVRKPQLPGQTKASVGCVLTFGTLSGMRRPIEILVKPMLGEAKTTINSIIYRSAKNGQDFVKVRFHWVGRAGALETSVGSYRIHVVDKPL
jgi:hypothetical protein